MIPTNLNLAKQGHTMHFLQHTPVTNPITLCPQLTINILSQCVHLSFYTEECNELIPGFYVRKSLLLLTGGWGYFFRGFGGEFFGQIVDGFTEATPDVYVTFSAQSSGAG